MAVDSKSSSVIQLSGQSSITPVDEDGIPVKAAYSIKQFLASLPQPAISDQQFMHLHKLAALTPPPPDSLAFQQKKAELEELVRLVEGVRDASLASHDSHDTLPDGRIWPEGEGMPLDWNRRPEDIPKDALTASGRELLRLANKTHLAGFYTVTKQQRGEEAE
ncbi:hypothetical protein EMMF5_001876 [Cystobasidiomycetes sp. EMM_F5]